MYSFIALLSSNNVIVILKIHFSFIGFVNDVPILFVTFHFINLVHICIIIITSSITQQNSLSQNSYISKRYI